jgi:DNA-binding PadR family transcriptional regulator
VEKSAKDSSLFLTYMLIPDEITKKRRPVEPWPIAYNQIRKWFADFAALGLIEPSTKKHHIKDPEDYWSITDKGKKIYASIRVAALERNALSEAQRDGVKPAENIESEPEKTGRKDRKGRSKSKSRS